MIGIIILQVRSVHLRYLRISISKIQIISFHKNIFKYSEYSKTSYEVAKEYSKRWRLTVLSYLHIVIEIMIHWDQIKYDRFLFKCYRNDESQSHFEWSRVFESRDLLNHFGIDIIWFIIRMNIESYFYIDALISPYFLIFCKDWKSSYWYIILLLFYI